MSNSSTNTNKKERQTIPEDFEAQVKRYNIYRYSTLGFSLIESLQMMVENNELDPDDPNNSKIILSDIVKRFDETIAENLNNHEIKTKDDTILPVLPSYHMTGKLELFRNCLGLWTFMVKDAEISRKLSNYQPTLNYKNTPDIHADYVKIIAVEQHKK